MRGKEIPSCPAPVYGGITPAYAGKSEAKEFACKDGRDHPRVCGEKLSRWVYALSSQGSPPRMRGKETGTSQSYVRLGITPAYAGKSTTAGRGRMPSRDHPRVCGEKNAASIWAICARGSPPRMRGKGVQPRDERIGVGITPAYAGKSTGRCADKCDS